jgi:hypothetical protein
LRPFSDVPLAEESEVFEIDIYDGVTYKRTLTATFIGPQSEPAEWIDKSSVFGSLAVPATTDDEGTVSFPDLGVAIATQSLEGDFVVEIGALPDNTKIAQTISIVPRGHEFDGSTPALFITRTGGADNDGLTISATDTTSISATDDTDITAPARYFIARRGSTVSIYKNSLTRLRRQFSPPPHFRSAFTLKASANGGGDPCLFGARIRSVTLDAEALTTLQTCTQQRNHIWRSVGFNYQRRQLLGGGLQDGNTMTTA